MAARDLVIAGLFSFWGDRVFLAIASAVAGFLLWRTPLRRPLVAAWCVTIAAWLTIAFTPLCSVYGNRLVRRDAPLQADAIFVLSSSLQPDSEPTNVAMARMFQGLALLAEGRAPRVILSELHPPQRSAAELMRSWLRRFGIEREVIAVGPVLNTRDEAVAASRLFRERGYTRVLLVTSPTHSLRASLAFENEGLTVISAPCSETRFDLEHLIGPDQRLAAFPSVVHEWVGIAVYRWRGWIQ